jgi:hypothetical protein
MAASSTKLLKGLYIIESLEFNDERKRREGQIVKQILRLCDFPAKYIYIRTQPELDLALKGFEKSRFRYLHFSCHGNRDTVAFTLDQMSFDDFAAEVNPYLDRRRVFFSACGVVNSQLAEALLTDSGCYSIIGPKAAINFDDALLTWASFYHLAFRDGEPALLGGKIRWALRRVRKAFNIEFGYFRSTKSGFEEVDIETK